MVKDTNLSLSYKEIKQDIKFYAIVVIIAAITSVFSYYYAKQMKPLYKNTTKILLSSQSIKLDEKGRVVLAENAPVRASGLVRTFGNFSSNINLAKKVAGKLGPKKSNKELKELADNIVVYIDKGTWYLNVDAFAYSKKDAYNIANTAGNIIRNKIQSNLDTIQPGKEAVIYKAVVVSPAQINKTYKAKPRQFRTAAATFLLIILIASCINILKNIFASEKNSV